MIIIHAVNDWQESLSWHSLCFAHKPDRLTRGPAGVRGRPHSEDVMLRWALIFLVVALIASVFGFGGIAAGAAGIAKLLFVLFLVVFVVSLILGLLRRA